MGYKLQISGLSNEIKQNCLCDRVRKLLVSFEWSDCRFCIFGQIFKAHRLILGISSPVFEAMFYGPLSSTSDVIITDIEPNIFQLILNYIYTDKVEINSMEEAFELLYASRKYILDNLTDICILYIKANISVDNVIEVLNYPECLLDENLHTFALDLFCKHASYLLEENKNMISFSCMRAILESDNINIKEYELVKHVFEWIAHYRKENDLSDNKLLFKSLIRLIRFHLISLTELDEIKNNSNNLLPQEVDEIKKIIIDAKSTSNKGLKYKNPRIPIKLEWCSCHRSPLRPAAPVVIYSNSPTIQCRVKANKSLFINAVCIPPRMAPVLSDCSNIPKDYLEQLSLSIVSEYDNNLLKSMNIKNTVEYNSTVVLELNEPCFIKKNEWYKINFTWPRNRFHTFAYVVELRERIYNGYKTVFEFDDLCPGSPGSFLEGLKFSL